MTDRISTVVRVLTAILVVIVYALLAHKFSTTRAVEAALLPVALVPLLIVLMLRLHRWVLLLLCALFVALMLWIPSARALLAHNLAWIYFAQDSALNVALCFVFGRTLRSGRVPLCSRLASVLHDNPSPHLLQYTRRVTIAWTIFFATMVLLSAGLFFFADRVIWSSFANLLYWPLLISMFALEYIARVFVLPRTERASFFATIGAARNFAELKFGAGGAR